MQKSALSVVLVSALGLAASSAVAAAPPSGSKPLSEIIIAIEQKGDVAYFDEIDWDDDDAYWEIEYITKSGTRVKTRIDPATGEARR